MMLLTISFYKSDDGENTPKSEHVYENSSFVKNMAECEMFFISVKNSFKNKNFPEGKYFIVRKTSGRKIKGYKNWEKQDGSDCIVIKDKYKQIKQNDSIPFPSGAGKRSNQTGFVEFIDDEGVGLDFLMGRGKSKKEPSQEYWTFEELEELGII